VPCDVALNEARLSQTDPQASTHGSSIGLKCTGRELATGGRGPRTAAVDKTVRNWSRRGYSTATSTENRFAVSSVVHGAFLHVGLVACASGKGRDACESKCADVREDSARICNAALSARVLLRTTSGHARSSKVAIQRIAANPAHNDVSQTRVSRPSSFWLCMLRLWRCAFRGACGDCQGIAS
jgi:hypothetical protein